MNGAPPGTPQDFVATPSYSPQLMIHNHHRPLQGRFSSNSSSNQNAPYRRESCLRFQRGKYGYEHNYHDGRLTPKFNNHNHNNNNNNNNRMRFCWRSENGGCPYGERCNFIHDNEYRKSNAISIVNGRSGARGFQRFGNAGNQKPLGWKTRPCKKWEANGSCSYGLSCFFAHGESELQKSGRGRALEYVTSPKPQVPRKQWVFKWTDVEKISRIYADWIENMPIVHDSSGAARN